MATRAGARRGRAVPARMRVEGSSIPMGQSRVVMTHVSLDGADESVRQFVLAVSRDPAGSVLEIDGRPVAWVVPVGPAPADGDETWTEAKNQRRCDLIDRKYAGGLAPAEAV